MNYQSEGEYNTAMQSQGEAEAEWQAYADYQNYLGSLYENGDFKLYFLHTIADDLESFKFKQSNKTPSQYLSSKMVISNPLTSDEITIQVIP